MKMLLIMLFISGISYFFIKLPVIAVIKKYNYKKVEEDNKSTEEKIVDSLRVLLCWLMLFPYPLFGFLCILHKEVMEDRICESLEAEGWAKSE